jgi:hypothetical protein
MAKLGKWKITNGSGQPAVGSALDGYHIEKTSGHYQLHGKLATAPINHQNPNGLPVTFHNVTIDGQTWDITVDDLPNSTDAGSWVTPSQQALRPGDTPPTSGEFTAQSDGVVPEEESAASAGYGKN